MAEDRLRVAVGSDGGLEAANGGGMGCWKMPVEITGIKSRVEGRTVWMEVDYGR